MYIQNGKYLLGDGNGVDNFTQDISERIFSSTASIKRSPKGNQTNEYVKQFNLTDSSSGYVTATD